MAKIATDLKQSQLLAEILPIESADMYYWCADHFPKEDWILEVGNIDEYYESIPAWSLSALMEALPKHPSREYNLVVTNDKPYAAFDDCKLEVHEDFVGENLVDACVEMIKQLHENDLL